MGAEFQEFSGQRPAGAHSDPWFWAILAVALAPRLWLVSLYPHARGLGDETYHYLNGVLISHLGTGLIGHWAPAYDSMLAAIFRLLGPDPAAARAVQAVLSIVTVWCVYRIALAMAGRGAARCAGALTAIDLGFIAFSQFFLSETLYTALLTGAVCALHHRGPGPNRRDLLLAGLLFGFSALTRSLVLWFFPLWIGWEWWCGRPEKARQAALVFAISIAVVLPWTLRNAAKYGEFLLVDSTLGRTAYLSYSQTQGDTRPGRDLGYDRGHHDRERPECESHPVPGLEPLPPARELMKFFPAEGRRIAIGERRFERKLEVTRRRAVMDLPAYQRCEISNAAAFARQHPDFVVRLMASNLYNFWGPTSFLLRGVHEGLYESGPLRRDNYPVYKAWVIASTLLVVCTALLALGRRGWPPVTAWCVLFIVFYTVIHAASIGHSRYRLPIMALLIAMSSSWLVRPTWPAGSSRRSAVALSVVAYLLLSAHYVARVLP